MLKEFQRVKDQILFMGNYMEVYIPKSYFDELDVAYFTGHKVHTLGIFSFTIFANPESSTGQKHVFKCPAEICLCPGAVDDMTMKVSDEYDEMNYTVLKFYKNDIFIDDVFILQAADNVKKFFNLLFNGKLPNTIPYDEIIKLMMDCLQINKVALGTPASTYEAIISEVCRDKKSIYESFRFRAGKSTGKFDMRDYKPVNIKSIARFNSTFSAVTFEDMDYSMTTSINKLRQNKEEKETPIEKTIKY